MGEVTRQRTPISLELAAKLLESTLKEVLEVTPVRSVGLLLLSQIWLETGRGTSMMNYNPGNISAIDTSNVSFWRPTWYTITESSSARDKALHTEMLNNRAPRAFRAYSSFEDGLRDYVSRIKTKFSSILEAARKGNVREFAEAVQSSRYCPDCNPASTTPTFESFVKEFDKKGLFASFPKVPEQVSPRPSRFSGLPPSFFGGHYELPLLRVGSSGSAVYLWQWLVGVDRDCTFGPKTEAATKDFQQQHGQLANGIVNRCTWAAALLDLVTKG